MSWTKLDDDAVMPDQPLSAFVGKRLTDNQNSYTEDLTRLSTFSYQTTESGDAKVKWASILGRRGTVVTVDVGVASGTYAFKVFCRTTNPALGGTLHIRDVDAGVTVSQHVAGTATPTVVSIPYVTNQVSGLRAFHVSWESDIGEDAVGSVLVNGAVDNQVFCEADTGPVFPFTTAPGSFHEMYHMLVLGTGAATPSPQGDALHRYQVCTFRHNVNPLIPPEGVLTVWPSIEVNPPIFQTSTGGGPKPTISSYLYELGRIELYSISVETYGRENNYPPPYVYQQTTPINRLNNKIDTFMPLLQPDACTSISRGGLLGQVIRAGSAASFAFFVQTNKSVQTLNVSFRAVAIDATQNAPDLTFGVVDYQGNTVGTDVVKTNVPVPRITGQTTMEPREGAAVFMNGVLAGDGNWGMRDAMDLDQALMGLPVRFVWGPNVQNDINQGTVGSTDAVYIGRLHTTADIYVYGFNCRVL